MRSNHIHRGPTTTATTTKGRTENSDRRTLHRAQTATSNCLSAINCKVYGSNQRGVKCSEAFFSLPQPSSAVLSLLSRFLLKLVVCCLGSLVPACSSCWGLPVHERARRGTHTHTRTHTQTPFDRKSHAHKVTHSHAHKHSQLVSTWFQSQGTWLRPGVQCLYCRSEGGLQRGHVVGLQVQQHHSEARGQTAATKTGNDSTCHNQFLHSNLEANRHSNTIVAKIITDVNFTYRICVLQSFCVSEPFSLRIVELRVSHRAVFSGAYTHIFIQTGQISKNMPRTERTMLHKAKHMRRGVFAPWWLGGGVVGTAAGAWWVEVGWCAVWYSCSDVESSFMT